MRVKDHEYDPKTDTYSKTIKVWFSAKDTYEWAHKPNAAWPCSTISNKRIFAEFHNGDLVDIAINGKCLSDENSIDGYEFNAFVYDMLGSVNPT